MVELIFTLCVSVIVGMIFFILINAAVVSKAQGDTAKQWFLIWTICVITIVGTGVLLLIINSIIN